MKSSHALFDIRFATRALVSLNIPGVTVQSTGLVLTEVFIDCTPNWAEVGRK